MVLLRMLCTNECDVSERVCRIFQDECVLGEYLVLFWCRAFVFFRFVFMLYVSRVLSVVVMVFCDPFGCALGTGLMVMITRRYVRSRWLGQAKYAHVC